MPLSGTMNFASDNWAGACDQVLDAISAAGRAAPSPAYGTDPLTERVEARLAEIFEHEVTVAFVPTGTAANALSCALFTPPWGAVVAHEEAHLAVDEAGAPEALTGARVLRLPGRRGKLNADDLARRLAETPTGLHHGTLSLLSLTQANEYGLAHSPAEVSALANVAKQHGMAVHMDGARFANALVRLPCSPADLTWKAGVDVLSFGGTKGGCFMAEAVILFSPERREELAFRRKRAGHLLSKHRLIAAQFDAWLTGDLWLDLARHADAMADRLAQGFEASPFARLAWSPEANEVFVHLPATIARDLTEAGVRFYEWSVAALEPDDRPPAGETLCRFVTSFATTSSEVDHFLALLNDRRS